METITEIPALESKIEQELVKHNVTESVLSSLKEKYAGLKLRSLDDKEKFLEIKEAAKECSKVRNLIVKCCKIGREDAVKVQKLWVAKEKEVVAKVTEVEAPLDAEIEKYNQEVDRKINEEKKRQEEAYMQRTQTLTRMGALYVDGNFELGEFCIEGNLVKETSTEVWNDEVLPRFTEEYNKAEAERIEQDRIKSEKEAESKRQMEELQKQQREFQAQQDEFKRNKEESERQKREELAAKEREELRVRSELQNKRFSELIPFNPHSSDIDMPTLWALDESVFNRILVNKKTEFEKMQEEKLKEISEQAAAKERQRIEEENRLSEIKRQQEEQRKAEELAKAGDKANWEYFIKALLLVPVPTVKSGQYRRIATIAKEKIEEIVSLKL